MATKATLQKSLLIGNQRICQQIAYVLDIQDYVCMEKLTAQNWEQYRDYQIYVCDFKRRSRGLIERTVRGTAILQYLDDICQKIDQAYYANRKQHANDLQNFHLTPTTKKTAPQAVATENPVKTKSEQQKSVPLKPTRRPLGWRLQRGIKYLGWCLKRGIKHPLRVVQYLSLRIKLRRKLSLTKNATKRRHSRRHDYHHIWYLHRLKPSELFLYVLQAPPHPQIQCTQLEDCLQVVNKDGNIRGCCSAIVPFGNLLYDGELDEIYNSTYARIVKLSSLNRSYCFCDLNRWCKGYCTEAEPSAVEPWTTVRLPRSITVGFDQSCNLCCKSCRNHHYVMDHDTRQHANMIATKLVRSGYLDQTQRMVVAGMGEVFYSPYYRQLLTTDLQRQQIEIRSNGTLFNADNWCLVAGKYSAIKVNISVDAATAETYQKLRGADFNVLMQNLTMLGDLRRKAQIQRLGLNFVVQQDNFREMVAFVQLGKSLGVDYVQFQRYNNFGNITEHEFRQRCLIINDEYLDYELWCVLQDPIFRDPMVDLRGMQRYIDASEKRYRPRYEREQGRP